MKTRLLSSLALAAAFLACSGENEGAPSGAHLPVLDEQVKGQSARRPDGTSAEARAPRSKWARESDPYVNVFKAPETEPAADAAARVTVGMTRAELLKVLGRCAARPYYLPQSSSMRMIEIFQPATPECVTKFGNRNFQVIHGKLEQIGSGMLEPAHATAAAQKTDV